MEMEAWPPGQPVADGLGLVRAVVVQDQMHVQFCGNVLFDGVEEVAELAGAMSLLGLANNLAGAGVERGEETGGAVALVIVGAPLDLAWPHRQQRCGAIRTATAHAAPRSPSVGIRAV